MKYPKMSKKAPLLYVVWYGIVYGLLLYSLINRDWFYLVAAFLMCGPIDIVVYSGRED